MMNENKKADLAFLEAVLTELTIPHMSPEERKDKVMKLVMHCKVPTQYRPKPIQRIYCMINQHLIDNFVQGYIKAVKKYGVYEGNEAIKRKLISIILENDERYDTEEELMCEMKKANAFAHIMTYGIHVTVDEGEC